VPEKTLHPLLRCGARADVLVRPWWYRGRRGIISDRRGAFAVGSAPTPTPLTTRSRPCFGRKRNVSETTQAESAAEILGNRRHGLISETLSSNWMRDHVLRLVFATEQCWSGALGVPDHGSCGFNADGADRTGGGFRWNLLADSPRRENVYLITSVSNVTSRGDGDDVGFLRVSTYG